MLSFCEEQMTLDAQKRAKIKRFESFLGERCGVVWGIRGGSDSLPYFHWISALTLDFMRFYVIFMMDSHLNKIQMDTMRLNPCSEA